MNYTLKNILNTRDILKYKFYLEKIELFTCKKEIVLFKEDIKKLIEETPSPVLSDEIRNKLLKSTVNMVEKLGY